MKPLIIMMLSILAAACSKGEDAGQKPVDPKAWQEKHKAAIDAWQAKLDAVVALTKDLPVESVRHAEPSGPFQIFLANYNGVSEEAIANQNAVIIAGPDIPGFPEYGTERDVDPRSGDGEISVNFFGYVDWDLYNVLREGKEPKYRTTASEADGPISRIAKLKYLIVTRNVEYKRGTVDVSSKTFMPGSFKGVAHVVELAGPKHLGSVAYSATNTESFESFPGSVEFMLKADLSHEAVRAFHAEMKKVFPMVTLPDPPAPPKKE